MLLMRTININAMILLFHSRLSPQSSWHIFSTQINAENFFLLQLFTAIHLKSSCFTKLIRERHRKCMVSEMISVSCSQLSSASLWKDTEGKKHKAPSQNISFNAVYTPRTISAVLFCRHKKPPRQGMYAWFNAIIYKPKKTRNYCELRIFLSNGFNTRDGRERKRGQKFSSEQTSHTPAHIHNIVKVVCGFKICNRWIHTSTVLIKFWQKPLNKIIRFL